MSSCLGTDLEYRMILSEPGLYSVESDKALGSLMALSRGGVVSHNENMVDPIGLLDQPRISEK